MRVLFVHNWPTEFVKIDRDALSRQFELREICFRFGALQPLTMLSAVAWAEVIVCWFASWYALEPVVLAKMLGRRVLVIAGGYDTANVPEIQYGHQRGGVQKMVSSWLIRHASLLVVNSHYSAREIESNIPGLQTPMRVIYHGIPDSFGDLPANKKQNRVITVGNVNRSNVLRKGLRWFCEASHFVPGAEFIVAGRIVDQSVDYLRSISAGNVRFTDYLSQADLATLYRSACVYAQPSRHEAFGMSVAESMLAGCIPVVSNHGALPEVAGSCGIVLKGCEARTVAEGIRKALLAGPAQHAAARAHVLTSFPLSRRERDLGDAVLQVMGAHSRCTA